MRGEVTHQPVLNEIGVLKFIYEHMQKTLAQDGADVGLLEKHKHLEQEVVEVHRVFVIEARLIHGVHAASDVVYVVTRLHRVSGSPGILLSVDAR